MPEIAHCPKDRLPIILSKFIYGDFDNALNDNVSSKMKDIFGAALFISD